MDKLTPGELMDLIAGLTAHNPEYLAELKRDPKRVLEKQLNAKLPAKLKIEVVENELDKIYLVLPFVPEGEAAQLDPLEAYSGGYARFECQYDASVQEGTRIERTLL